MKSRYCVVFITTPSKRIAQKISLELLRRRLIACANVSSSIDSTYWWLSKINNSKEVLVIMKTRSSLYSKLEKAILKLHPYDVPEIVALPIIKGSGAYLKWIDESTLREDK